MSMNVRDLVYSGLSPGDLVIVVVSYNQSQVINSE